MLRVWFDMAAAFALCIPYVYFCFIVVKLRLWTRLESLNYLSEAFKANMKGGV